MGNAAKTTSVQSGPQVLIGGGPEGPQAHVTSASFVGAGRAQDVTQAVVPLVAGVLEHAVSIVTLQREGHRPRPRPRLWIVDRHRVLQRVGAGAREALDAV